MMGLVRRSLVILLVYIWVLCFCTIPLVTAQSDTTGVRAFDALLQDYAYRAFIRPKTGVVYEGTPPSNLTGIKISAMRLRSGSLRRRGVSAYKEFRIPEGVIEQPFVTRLVLVYHNLGNWSTLYYPLPNGYTYVSPVLGLLAYDASNLSAINLPSLDLRAFGQPISIQFSVPNRLDQKCVWFSLNGSIIFSDIISGNICSTYQLGHFSVVFESGKQVPENKNNKNRVWIIVGSVLGGLVLLTMLAILALFVYKYRKKKKMQRMESAAEAGEALETTSVGNTRAPSATVTRTQPSLETEYGP